MRNPTHCWEIQDESDDFSTHIVVIDPAVSYNRCDHICLVSNGDLTHAKALAIAHQLTAAPDMLEVLEEWLAIAAAQKTYLGSTGDKARAAIAKAKGVACER